MKSLIKLTIVFAVIGTLCVSIFPIVAQEKPVKAEEPVLVTSCGQSPGPIKLKIFMKRLKIDHVYDLQVTAADLVAKKKEGTPYKSMIIVTGASLKGMGAAGISIDDEIKRAKALIAEAKKQGITMIGAHIEGMARRAQGAAEGDNSDEMSIDAVCPVSDLMIIKKEGDSDGRFTAISKNKKIPMLVFDKNMELGDVLKKLYSK